MQLLHNRKNKSFIWTENKAILNFDRIKKTEVIFFGNPLLCRQYSEPIFVMLGINLWHWYDVCGDFLWLSGEDSYLLVLKLRCAYNACKKRAWLIMAQKKCFLQLYSNFLHCVVKSSSEMYKC